MRGYGLQGERDVAALVDDGTLPAAYVQNHRQGVRASGRACDTGGLVSNSAVLPRSQRSSCRATTSTPACLRRAHSQTVATRQPAWSRSWRLRRSRSIFASNLALQNSWRVVGVVAYGQPVCRCQKQPCTRHTAPNRRNARSGVPGSLRSCSRNRIPRAWMARRRATSGRVFLLPIPAIMSERVARSTMSAIVVRVRILEEYRRKQTIRDVSSVLRPDEMPKSGTDLVGAADRRCSHVPIANKAAGSVRGVSATSRECHP